MLFSIMTSKKFLSLVEEKIDFGKLQDIMNPQDKSDLVNVFIQLINNGWKMTYLVAARVLDLNAEPKLPFSGAKLHERIGMSGKIVLDFKEIKAINKLKEDEGYISGHKFKKRLIDDKETLFNSNLIDELITDQDEPDVKAFLDKYKDKVLVDFGDVFSGSGGDLCVRCAIVFVGRWVSHYRWLGYGWYERSLALVLAKETKKL